MFDLALIKNNTEALKDQLSGLKNNNIGGVPLSDYIFNKIVTRIDPVEYCERVLRSHLPPHMQHLHENQIELVRAVCNPRKIAA